MSCTNKNSMTEKDQEDVKLVISKYLQAVLHKDFETVMELTESNQKKCCYSIEELIMIMVLGMMVLIRDLFGGLGKAKNGRCPDLLNLHRLN